MAAGERTAFVFAGGGSLGAIQVGALRELVRAGVTPDFLVGASVGSLNACYFASRPDLEGVKALEEIWRGIRREDVFPWRWRAAFSGMWRGSAIFSAEPFRRLVEEKLPLRRLEDAQVPVHVVATGPAGETVRLSRGPVADAVLASAAIPIAFPPVEIEGMRLVDGAVAGNTPVLTAAELGATRIVVLQTGYACSMDGPPRSAVASGLHALTLLIANQLERDLRLLDGKVDVHVAPHLCPLDVSPFDFRHAESLIERSAAGTVKWLELGGLDAPATPEGLRHDHANMRKMSSVALGGLDPVSYFSKSAPEEGRPEFAAQHAGRDYLFASADNRARFLSDPEAFLPQYGGVCAYAMARGGNAPGDPRVYDVIGGRLYLNASTTIRAKWIVNPSGEIERADARWRTAGRQEKTA